MKDNVIIKGIPYHQDEDTDQIVIDLAKDAGVEIKKDDISTSHRLSASRQNSAETVRQKDIIVKFVRRNTKVDLMKKKKNLKNVASRKNVFLNDQLTPLRAKILREIKKETNVKSAWTIDGKIFCLVTENGRDRKITIDSGDELITKLGWSEDKVVEAGIYRKI